MEKLLISACLCGENTRYDGKNNHMPELIEELSKYFDLVLFCPEVVGGLPTPRKPSEIRNHAVYHNDGTNVTDAFVKGAHEAYRLCSYFGIRDAVLKEGSPSCGSHKIHNGYFDGRMIDGQGMTTGYLESKGIKVFSEETVASLLEGMKKREQIYAERDRIRVVRAHQEQAEQRERRPRPTRGDNKPRREGTPKGDRKQGDKKPYRKSFDRKPGGKRPYRTKKD